MSTKRVEVTVNPETNVMAFKPLAEGAEAAEVDLNVLFPGVVDAIKATDNGETALRALVHGMRQKLGDVYADKSKVPDNEVAKRVTEVADAIKAGQWNVKGSGGGGSRATLLAEALANVRNMPLDEVMDRLESFSAEDRKEIPKQYPEVKAEMERLSAERQAEKARKAAEAAKNSDANLDDLFADDDDEGDDD